MNTARWATGLVAAALLGALATGGLASSSNWNTRVERADGAHVIGKPDATRVLTEFVSYTCPHCAEFARTGDEALKLAHVGPGKIRLEIRHIVRDPVDLTVAMLTWCGDTAKFPRNHAAFMSAQPRWLATARSTTPAQRQRWSNGDLPSRTRAVASDLGFYRIMEGRDYDRVAIDRCLADISERDAIRFNVAGTPSFALDGKLLPGVHDWRALEKVLRGDI
ncbi:MAG: hypothetical protein B7X57_09980, partial [Erythrobacter sp. 34-65-8]